MKEEPVIRPATMADILAVDALRKAESDALGFVPIQTYEDVTKRITSLRACLDCRIQ